MEESYKLRTNQKVQGAEREIELYIRRFARLSQEYFRVKARVYFLQVTNNKLVEELFIVKGNI